MSFYDDIKSLIMVRSMTAEEKETILTSPDYLQDRERLQEKGALELLGADEETLTKCLTNALVELVQRLTDKKSEDARGTPALNDYLASVVEKMLKGEYLDLEQVSQDIAQYGNAPVGEDEVLTENNGIELVLQNFRSQIKLLEDGWNGVDPSLPSYPGMAGALKNIEYLEQVFDMSEMLYTVKVAGTEEHVVGDVGGVEEELVEVLCTGDSECGCGCQMNGMMTLLEGTEDYLSGRDTPALRYLEGVMYANDSIPYSVAGQEGPIFDKLRNGAMTVYKTLFDSLKAMKDAYSNKTDEEKVKSAEASADSNTTSLAALDDQTAHTNPEAQKGIITLAEQVDPSGEMKSIVSGMNSPKDAIVIMGKLVVYMKKQASANSILQKAHAEATKLVEELKTAAGKLSSSDETNKDVASVLKEELAEKTKQAREGLKKAKEALTGHNKLMEGIKKAISATTPSIFKKSEDKKD